MNTRKSMTLPVIITFIIIIVMVSFFTSIKQTVVTCERTSELDGGVRLREKVVSSMDNKKIKSLSVTKTILLSDRYQGKANLTSFKYALENTLEYLGDKVKYTIGEDYLVVQIDVNKNEVILLNNIDFIANEDLTIKINSNTKSSDVITLTVGDNYTDGELMKRLKNNGYSCK